MKLGHIKQVLLMVATVAVANLPRSVDGHDQRRASLFCEDSNWVESAVGNVYACYKNEDSDDHCKSYKTFASRHGYDKTRYDEYDDVSTYFVDCHSGDDDDVAGICRYRDGDWDVLAECDDRDEEAVIPVIRDTYGSRRKQRQLEKKDTKLRHQVEIGEKAIDQGANIVDEIPRDLKMEFTRTSRSMRKTVRIDGDRWIILDYDKDFEAGSEEDDDDDDDEEGEDDGKYIAAVY